MPELEHLRWQKLVLPAAPRKKPKGFGQSPPLRDRVEHSEVLVASVNAAIESVQAERQKLGLNPTQMLVLEFVSVLGSDVRKILEDLLGLHILSEAAIERPLPAPIYSVEIQAPERRNNRQLLASLDFNQLGIEAIEPVRASSGDVDARKTKIIFSSRPAARFFKPIIARNPLWANWRVTGATTTERETYYKTLVQFPDGRSIQQLRAELAAYRINGAQIQLTPIQRAKLFDAFEQIGAVAPEDRLGVHAQEDGFPDGEFFFDLDLWHTGEDATQEMRDATAVIENAGGQVSNIKAVADMLILVRVKGTAEVARKLLAYDRVSRLDLPPNLPPQVFDIFDYRQRPAAPVFVAVMPRACVIDSGVLPSHPLITGGVIDSRDFDSGERTAVDRVGHGTHVAGIVVYGDVVLAMQQNRWIPKVQVVNAKVMRKGPFGAAEFAEEKRVETQLEEAIRWAVETQECRVFNLSLGNAAIVYSRGHQLPWALLLDTLARELDIVIIVSAGNNTSPLVPSAATSVQLQTGVLENLFGPDHALIDPATAALALTVGAVARLNQPSNRPLVKYPGDIHPPVASPVEGPSAFTRTGTCDARGGGLHRSVKPELVAYGGNYLLRLWPEPYEWAGSDPHLGEPSLAFDFPNTGKLFASACGTSFAAPFVTHIAARVEHLFKQSGEAASANLIRALIVNSAKHAEAASSFVRNNQTEDPELSILRSMGYGKPNPETALYSDENRVVLYSEDEVAEDHYHLYELRLPEEFIRESGRRRIRLTLAYDPPVRGSRKEYIARTMWFELFRDVTAAEIQAFTNGSGRSITSNSLPLKPTLGRIEWSTVQSASFEIGNSIALVTHGQPRLFHVLVGCQQRFNSGEEPLQRYALVATLEHEKNDVQLYEAVKAQVQAQQVRNRARLRS